METAVSLRCVPIYAVDRVRVTVELEHVNASLHILVTRVNHRTVRQLVQPMGHVTLPMEHVDVIYHTMEIAVRAWELTVLSPASMGEAVIMHSAHVGVKGVSEESSAKLVSQSIKKY